MLKRRMLRGIMGLFLLVSVVQASAKEVNIAVLSDGRLERSQISTEQLKAEIRALLNSEFDVRFDERYRYEGDWNTQRIKEASDKVLKDKSVDMVLAMGVINANYLASYPNLPKPVIAPFIIDPDLQGIPMREGRSGVKNFTYVTQGGSPGQFLGRLQNVASFSNLAILAEGAVLENIPRLQGLISQLELLGLKLTLLPSGATPEDTLAAIDQGGDFDAVLLAPLPRFTLSDIKQIADGLIQRDLPGFTVNGREEVEQGLLAGYATEEASQRLVRRIALNVQRILLGERPESIPVNLNTSPRVILNQRTARALDRFPDFSIIDEYVVINQNQYEKSRKLTLRQVMELAMQRNLGVAATAYQTEASRANLDNSFSRLLPDVNLVGNYRRQDPDISAVGNPEERTLGQVTLSQPLYSDEAIGFYQAQKYEHLSQEDVLQQQRLDVALNAATTYLNMLSARETERLQKENLERASRNLELAQVRKQVGSAAAGEVHRWESEIATSRANYAQARSTAAQQNLALLSLLNYPQAEYLEAENVTVENSGFFFNDERFDGYVASPWSFRKFHEFMVQEALLQSPDVKQLDSQLKAQERNLTTARRRHWAPLVTADASVTETFDTSGRGASAAQEDSSWQVGINASLPLFSGGGDKAAVTVARETLLAVRMQLNAVKNNTERNVRTQLLAAEASYPTMQYTANAAEAARKNLDLVTDAYKRGAVSIIDLIDAQNAALSAEINAVNAVYNFMIDYFTLERAVGRFDILSNEADKNDWFKRINEFFNHSQE